MSDTSEHPGRRALPWLALLLSVIAVVMSAVALLRPSPEPVVASGEYERIVSEVWRLAHAVYGEMELQMPGKLTDAPETLTEALQPFFDIAQPVIADIEPPPRSGLSSFKGWELYCWPAEPPRDGWKFSLLMGTNRLKLDEEIAREPICGINELHSALRELAPGEFIGLLPWKSWADRDLIAEVQSMCHELDLEFWSPMDVSLMDEQSWVFPIHLRFGPSPLDTTQPNVYHPGMATNLDLNDNLIEEARRVGRHTTKKAAVTAALKEYVHRRKAREILTLFGHIEYWPEYDYKAARRSRPDSSRSRPARKRSA